MNKMQRTKIIIALAAVAALTLAIVGLAAAQLAPNQTYTGETPYQQAPGSGFLGWIGNCFGYGASQPYGGQYVAPPVGSDGSTPAPYQPYQGGYGYGYGPCWAR